jgi:hypothetical protein
MSIALGVVGGRGGAAGGKASDATIGACCGSITGALRETAAGETPFDEGSRALSGLPPDVAGTAPSVGARLRATANATSVAAVPTNTSGRRERARGARATRGVGDG